MTPPSTAADDPLFPWLLTIRKALEAETHDADLNKLLSDCMSTFKRDSRYRNDPRLLKIWLLHLESSDDTGNVLREMEECKICIKSSVRYELFAALLEAKEKWKEAHVVYQMGISRKAQPLDSLKDAYALFLKRMLHRRDRYLLLKIDEEATVEHRKNSINPWSTLTMEELLKKISPQLVKYDGYHLLNKAYSGDAALPSLRNASRNKIIKIGGRKYQIKGCAGKGGFAQVFKAYMDCNPDDVVALKIQTPPFPWEFYMYRLLDQRILGKQRSGFGYAHRMHLYSDYSILVCDYCSHGTLQDVINSYWVVGKFMEEVLCIYYTIEMLYMLETLHGVGIIHGDFKPDNLLIRYSRDDLVALEDEFRDHQGSWGDQGLYLVDWGRGIDLHLFPGDVVFEGDCRTSGFRCVEMQEKKQWKFQVDTYGLCVAAHLMLHNAYMQIEKRATPDGTSYIYLPKTSFKRYWNVDLWKNLFTQLLNSSPGNDREMLQNLRKDFQDYLCSNNQLLKKLKDLLAKQRLSLCSS